jgi:hypothetical protein
MWIKFFSDLKVTPSQIAKMEVKIFALSKFCWGNEKWPKSAA